MIGRVRLRRAALAALIGLAPTLPAIAAPVKLSVETDYRLGYDINPFLTAGDNLASAYVQTSIAPKLSKRTEKGEMALSGHFDRTAYLDKYGKSDQYGGQFELQQRVTPKLNMFAALRYDSDVIGQGDDDVTGIPIDDIDVNLIGTRRRSDTYAASGGFQYQATPRDTISVDGGYTATRYGNGPGGGDSDTMGGRVAWQRAINARTKVGISGSVYRIDYDTPGISTLIMEPRVTFSTELSATWHVDASLGVSFSDLSLPPPMADRRTKGLSGSVNLCHKGTRDDFCFFAARSVSASGVGGSVESTQLGMNYNRKITERLDVVAGGSYARSETQSGLFPTREYVSAHGGLNWHVTRQITVGTEGRYRDVFGGGPIKGDLGGEIFAIVALPGTR